MPNVVRRGHVNLAAQSQMQVIFTASEETAAAAAEAAAEAVAPVEARVDALEDAVADGFAANISTIAVDLPVGRRSGHVDVEPEGGFSDTQISAPVMVTVAPNQGGIEGVHFAGEVINRRKLRLHWSAPGPVPSRVIVSYIIGNRQEE